MHRKRGLIHLALFFLFATETRAGPYSRARNDPTNAHDAPIPGFIGPAGPGLNDPENQRNPLFVAWASQASDYLAASELDPGWMDPSLALGPVTGDQFDIVGLGELDAAALDAGDAPGHITLRFPFDLVDGPGPDFAVFENGFSGFMELAYVEVSSDGVTFVRFPPVSLTPAAVPSYTAFDPTQIFNLAGKHHNNNGESWGTPFDLAALADAPGFDRTLVRFVRLVDIPGRGDFFDASTPPRPIFDPWPTFGSGGFDLEAVGMIHARVKLLATSGEGAWELHWTRVPNRLNRLWKSSLGPAGPWEPFLDTIGEPRELFLSYAGPEQERACFRVELRPLP